MMKLCGQKRHYHLTCLSAVVTFIVALRFGTTEAQSSRDAVLATVLVDSRRPYESSSPGWNKIPENIEANLGAFVYFNCYSKLDYDDIHWLVNGEKVDEKATRTNRVSTYNNRHALKYGPIRESDDGTLVGCEIHTSSGVLPSPEGKITVTKEPSYSPVDNQVAIVGYPYDFDLNYTAPNPPNSYSWYKNGQLFRQDEYNNNDGGIMVDHTGITFVNVRDTDAGLYEVVARNKKGRPVSAKATLKVVYWAENGQVQSGSKNTPTMSSKLAVSIAISLEERRKNPDAAPALNGTISYGPSGSDVGSTHRALGIIRSLLSPASHGSVQHSHARRRVEAILRDVLKNVRAEDLTDYDMKRINDFANCTNIVRHVDCNDYNNLRYRTIDGTCNNFFYPLNGAAETPLARLLPAVYEDGVSIPVGHKQATEGDPFSPPWPSPRHISWKMVKNLEVPNTGTTHMLMQWGQFLDHDLDISPIIPEEECMDCEFTDACLPILVNPRDTVYGVKKFECLPFSRSIPACVCGAAKRSLPRNQINQLTAYIDASNVYGSSNELSDSLRLMSGGLLKQGGRQDSLKGNLPFQTEKPAIGDVPFFVAGDERSNEQLALTIMHTVWMRQHNRIARALSDINPCWNDERIFQETRKIVGAQMQVITFKEYLPIVFGVNYEAYIPSHRGYNPFVDASIPNSFSAAAYRFGHSLVRPLLERLDKDFKPEAIGHLPLSQAFFNPIEYFRSGGTDPILRGLISDTSNAADIFVNSVLTSKLFTEAEDKLGMDLASLNIQRGRDHGLPSYRQWEQLCGKLFPDVKPKFASRDIARGLRNVYGSEGFKYGIDLWVGGLAEKRIPGGQVGPTFACILSLAFNRIRDGDRFWYENPYVFKASQRYEVMQHTSLAKVVCENADHIPRLQRSVFRLGGEKVDCSKIDDINLWKWWDRSCYYQRYYTKYYG